MKILKIGASWCKGCIIMGPRWKEIEKENPSLKTEYFDFDKDKDKIEKHNITAMPTFIFLDKNDNELTRLSGEVEKSKIMEVINQYKEN
jgi:thiol-disulfide isomerase/thioredoxin